MTSNASPEQNREKPGEALSPVSPEIGRYARNQQFLGNITPTVSRHVPVMRFMDAINNRVYRLPIVNRQNPAATGWRNSIDLVLARQTGAGIPDGESEPEPTAMESPFVESVPQDGIRLPSFAELEAIRNQNEATNQKTRQVPRQGAAEPPRAENRINRQLEPGPSVPRHDTEGMLNRPGISEQPSIGPVQKTGNQSAVRTPYDLPAERQPSPTVMPDILIGRRRLNVPARLARSTITEETPAPAGSRDSSPAQPPRTNAPLVSSEPVKDYPETVARPQTGSTKSIGNAINPLQRQVTLPTTNIGKTNFADNATPVEINPERMSNTGSNQKAEAKGVVLPPVSEGITVNRPEPSKTSVPPVKSALPVKPAQTVNRMPEHPIVNKATTGKNPAAAASGIPVNNVRQDQPPSVERVGGVASENHAVQPKNENRVNLISGNSPESAAQITHNSGPEKIERKANPKEIPQSAASRPERAIDIISPVNPADARAVNAVNNIPNTAGNISQRKAARPLAEPKKPLSNITPVVERQPLNRQSRPSLPNIRPIERKAQTAVGRTTPSGTSSVPNPVNPVAQPNTEKTEIEFTSENELETRTEAGQERAASIKEPSSQTISESATAPSVETVSPPNATPTAITPRPPISGAARPIASPLVSRSPEKSVNKTGNSGNGNNIRKPGNVGNIENIGTIPEAGNASQPTGGPDVTTSGIPVPDRPVTGQPVSRPAISRSTTIPDVPVPARPIANPPVPQPAASRSGAMSNRPAQTGPANRPPAFASKVESTISRSEAITATPDEAVRSPQTNDGKPAQSIALNTPGPIARKNIATDHSLNIEPPRPAAIARKSDYTRQPEAEPTVSRPEELTKAPDETMSSPLTNSGEPSRNITSNASGQIARKNMMTNRPLTIEPLRPAAITGKLDSINLASPIGLSGHIGKQPDKTVPTVSDKTETVPAERPIPAPYPPVVPNGHNSINRRSLSGNIAADIGQGMEIPETGREEIKTGSLGSYATKPTFGSTPNMPAPVQRRPEPLSLEPARPPVQRAVTIDSIEATTEPQTQSEPEQGQAQGGPDIDALANDVYRILRRRLLNERERAFGVS